MDVTQTNNLHDINLRPQLFDRCGVVPVEVVWPYRGVLDLGTEPLPRSQSRNIYEGLGRLGTQHVVLRREFPFPPDSRLSLVPVIIIKTTVNKSPWERSEPSSPTESMSTPSQAGSAPMVARTQPVILREVRCHFEDRIPHLCEHANVALTDILQFLQVGSAAQLAWSGCSRSLPNMTSRPPGLSLAILSRPFRNT